MALSKKTHEELIILKHELSAPIVSVPGSVYIMKKLVDVLLKEGIEPIIVNDKGDQNAKLDK